MTRKVLTDDFVMKDGDEEFHPHAGEWVTMKKSIGAGDLKLLYGFADVDTEDVKSTLAARDRICQLLARVIFDWSWTGPDGEPYSKAHGNVEAFDVLEDEELMYLMEKFREPGNAPKNLPSEPSTS
jgi:hypothetical protein